MQKALRSLETGLTGLDEIAIEGFDAAKGIDDADNKAAIRAALGTPTPDRLLKVAQAMRLGANDELIHDACRIDPWFLAEIRGSSTAEAEIKAKGLPTTAGAFRRLKAMGFSDARLGKLTGIARRDGDAKAPRARRAAGVQAHRHLRGRIRLAHGLHVLDLRDAVRGRRRRRGGAVRQEEGHHPRRRAEPHRPGHRVRLLLLPRRLRAEGSRLRDHHGQLQSGNGVDRLRHLRPALFRAAHAGRRAGDHRHRAQQRHAARRHRAVRRPDAAQARRAAGESQGADPRHLARHDRSRRRPRPLQEAARQAQGAPAGERHRHLAERGARHRRRDRLSGGDPAVLRAGRARHGDRARRRPARPLRGEACGRSRPAGRTRGLQAQPAADRPLSVRRHRSRRRLPLRRQGHLHRRHHGAHRGSRHSFRRLGLRAAAAFARRERPSPNSSGRPARSRSRSMSAA